MERASEAVDALCQKMELVQKMGLEYSLNAEACGHMAHLIRTLAKSCDDMHQMLLEMSK